MRVLLISADPLIREQLETLLSDQNLEVVATDEIGQAMQMVGQGSFCLYVVDENAHDGPGVLFVQQLRQEGKGTPVVLLMRSPTALSKIEALDLGVDDVLHWPVAPGLLLAQIRSLLRRCQPGESAVLRFEDVTFDLRSLEATRAGRVLSLTSREMAILEYLLRNPGRLITRNELIEAVWDSEFPPESNVVDVFFARLRQKLDKPSPVPLIHTVIGRGYMLSVSKPGAQAG